MKKVITFLGKYPRLTRYQWGEQVYDGHVFAQALRQFVNDYDEMLVLVTEEARTSAWPTLEALGDRRIRPLTIPRGETSQEMWMIFDTVIQHVDEQDHVVFDITHGLRSLPFLVFLFAAYLKTAKGVTIDGIYYGALELGTPDQPAPVIDLSEFVGMLDWLSATDQFVQLGDARRLSGLMQPEKAGRASQKAAEMLLRVSQAALLCQPFTLMRSVRDLETSLGTAEKDLVRLVPPFGILSQQIGGAFGQFATAKEKERDLRSVLESEYNLIEWYMANSQVYQAMTLSREWLIDGAAFRLGQPLDLDRTQRDLMERAVSGMARLGRMLLQEDGESREFTVSDLNEYGRAFYAQWPAEADLLKKVWNDLEGVRNGLAHAEHQKQPIGLTTLLNKSEQILPQLRALAQRWQVFVSS